MLSAIREKATGWIAWMIVILISIPFALWGVNSYFEGATQIVIAVANDVGRALHQLGELKVSRRLVGDAKPTWCQR